jgi:predicted XRE-type DNA-binding protein
MAKSYKRLRAKMTPASRARAEERANQALLEMNLQELRQRCTSLKQEELAELLRVTQAHVSKLERRGDILISTLYEYVRALGGDVDIRVRIPGQKAVRITQFEDVGRILKKASGE